MQSPSDQLDLIERGVENIISREELLEKLGEKRPLRVKLGVDPTAKDLHLGFTVVLRKLRQFQDLGHQAILIIGDYTARVGDPSGRNKTRPQLTEEEVEANARDYLKQAEKVLDLKKLEIRRNGEWFSKMSFMEVIQLTARMTVSQMLERDDFSKRFNEEIPISIHEFIYPLMQGWDSVMIEADLELGGSDQLFNLLVGRQLQRERGQKAQACLTMPLLVGTDGAKKMSKSYGNYIGISDEPKSMYDKTLSIPDTLLPNYWTLLTGLPLDRIDPARNENIQTLKKELAVEIVRLYHGAEVASRFVEGQHVYTEYSIPPEELAGGNQLSAMKLLVLCGLAPSNTQARKAIEEGSVRLNDQKVTTIDPIEIPEGAILRMGKKGCRKILLGTGPS